MKETLSRLYHRLADVIPLTWQGALLLLGGGTMLYFWGVKAEDWVLLMVGLFAMILPILSSTTVGLFALWVRYRLRRLNPEPNRQTLQTNTSQVTVTDFKLPRILLPILDFEATWESPPAQVSDLVILSERIEQVSFSRRGLYSAIVRKFALGDLFGLAEVRWRTQEDRAVEVWPQPHAHQAPFVRAFTEDTEHFVPSRPRRGDYVDTRAYIPGDPIRHIHWKLFARTREPFVRVPEPSASFEHQIIAYLVTSPHDDLAAAAVRWDLEHGHFGEGWKFGTDHAEQVATDVYTARRMLAMSGSRLPAGGIHLESFLSAVSFDPTQQRLLVYASGELAYWLPHILPMLKKHTAVISVIIASEDNLSLQHPASSGSSLQGSDVSGPKHRWRDWFVHPEPTSYPPTPRWREQLQTLHREGLQIQFIHSSHL